MQAAGDPDANSGDHRQTNPISASINRISNSQTGVENDQIAATSPRIQRRDQRVADGRMTCCPSHPA
jgi:hypothetical protein